MEAYPEDSEAYSEAVPGKTLPLRTFISDVL